MTPRARPLTIEPRMEPIPPMTTTAKTTMTSEEPIRGLTWMIGVGELTALVVLYNLLADPFD